MLAKRCEPAINELGIVLGQRRIVEPQGPGARWRDVAEHHIGTPCQALYDVPPSHCLVINGDAGFIAVERQKNGAVTPLTRFQLAPPVTLQGLNLDHPSTQVAQEQRAKRTRQSL